MADTQPLAPTDAEIDAAWREAVAKHEKTADFVRDFARSVLAKWGTPPAGAGAPVVWRSWDSENSRWNLTLWPDEWAGHPDVWEPLYTTPQPTQAQAGAVPLTREQVKEICVESGYETATLQERADFINGIRHAERHHGIKGGQHGL